ncbi:MAG: flagellar biosynthesis protein FlgA [SAR202 cluster bacterium]|nr:flagellar biosynthesis protein FlgA [SAR202 cluster bacterium]|tara:strand:- start:229 stop:1569 length:1341 start_codon:yes stop_codon:yes gene_type:complete
MRKLLEHLENSQTPINVGLVGCGRFGSMAASQIFRTNGMRLSLVCDINTQSAVKNLANAGIPNDLLNDITLKSPSPQNSNTPYIDITDDFSNLLQANLDVIVESTGNPEVGAYNAFKAIESEKHLIMVNVEADVLVGPILNKLAHSKNVVYSLAFGDQPALIEELYDWALSTGFEVVTAGKGTKYLPEYRKAKPNDAYRRYGYSQNEFKNNKLNPKMYNSFLDGTKSAVEMCSVANMTGMIPDIPGMHFPPASIDDIPSILIPKTDGGILSKSNVVEVISCLNRDGSEISNSLRWGVFIVITTDSKYLRSCIKEYGVPTDSTGKYAVMWRPYHFVGMETPISIAKAHLYKEATGSPQNQTCEVVAKAKNNLFVKEVLEGEGGNNTYGVIVEQKYAADNNLLPIGLCDKAKLIKSVNDDDFIRMDEVELDSSSFAANLRSSMTTQKL